MQTGSAPKTGSGRADPDALDGELDVSDAPKVGAAVDAAGGLHVLGDEGGDLLAGLDLVLARVRNVVPEESVRLDEQVAHPPVGQVVCRGSQGPRGAAQVLGVGGLSRVRLCPGRRARCAWAARLGCVHLRGMPRGTL